MELNDSSRLIKIGEFARLGGVSIKALRIYDEIGLLRPSAVDSQNRYRLYSTAQLSKLHRILMLKSAGLPLSQIGNQLAHRDEATLSKIRASLHSRAEQVRQQLEWIDAEICSIRNSGMAAARVVVKHAQAMQILAQRRTVDSYDDADSMLRDLSKKAPTRARVVSGAIWHDCGAKTRIIDCEAFWVLSRDLHCAAMKTLSGAAMASILHEGDESNIGETYEAARRWIVDNRYEIAGPNRELYLSATRPGMALVEIQFPISKRS